MAASSWRETTLGDFVRLQRGHDLTDADRRLGPVPVMGSAGQRGFHDTAKAKGPGVVIGRSGVGSMGVVSYSPDDYWPHNTVLYVTDFLGNDHRFVYYFLQHLNLRRFDSGSAQASLNRNYIYPIRIRVPDVPEQRRIAGILGALDDKIELNRRMNHALESIARAIFKSWFVDFDPVRKQMEGGEVDLPPDLATLFPASFEDSTMGSVPRGWPVIPLSSLVNVNPKYALARGSRVPYVEMSGLPADAARITQWRIREFTSGSRFRNGDVLVARITPCLENGKTALVDFLDGDETAWGSTEFLVLRPQEPVPTEYVYCLSRSDGFRDYAVGSMNGSSGRQRVPVEALERLPVVRPPDALLGAFGQVAHSAVALMAMSDLQCPSLVALRDSLLPQLLAGRLTAS